jgi:hypothetical protein
MSQGAKPGYGPKDPTAIRGMQGGANPNAEKRVIKGMAVNPAIVRSAVDAALSTSAALRGARAGGTPGHTESAAHNKAMAELQQHDTLSHASVLAIHVLETRIAEGKEDKHTREQLKQAHANLRARLAQGASRRYAD